MNLEWLLYSLLPILTIASEYDRTIKTYINPGCENCNNVDINLLYVEATGTQDTIHNVWDFTNGMPTILFIVTNLNTSLDFVWNDINRSLSKVEPTSKPKYSFGIVLNRILEYDDVNDTARYSKDAPTKPYDTKDMHWKRTNLVMQDDHAIIKVISQSRGFGVNKKQGEISIQLSIYPFVDYANILPHLIHTSNSSLIDIMLKDMELTKGFNNSRFALEWIFISTEKDSGNMEMRIRKGLDDEHTPGVFEILEFVTPESKTYGDGGFIQYRPVSYTSPNRNVAQSTNVMTGDLNRTTVPENMVAYDYFNVSGNVLAEMTIVSLGGIGDKFYKKTNYSTWSFTAGYGYPPGEGLSMLIILILSIGLGVPLVLIVLGGIFVCVKRRSKSDNPHTTLVEE